MMTANLNTIDWSRFVPTCKAEISACKLVKAGLRLREAWTFAFDEAYHCLELAMTDSDSDEQFLDELGKFVEENCNRAAYRPYVALEDLVRSYTGGEPSEEQIADVCDLLTEIADSATEFWTKKFQH